MCEMGYLMCKTDLFCKATDNKETPNTLIPIKSIGTLVDNVPWNQTSKMWVLDYYDGERIRLVQTPDKSLFLGWWSDNLAGTDRWIYLPLSENRFKAVCDNTVLPFEAMTNPEEGHLFIVDYESGDWDMPDTAVKVTPEDLEKVTLPDPIAKSPQGWSMDIVLGE